jgi:hypothetical protein
MNSLTLNIPTKIPIATAQRARRERDVHERVKLYAFISSTTTSNSHDTKCSKII